MINFDDYTNENKTEHNLEWSHIPDHPCAIKCNKQPARY